MNNIDQLRDDFRKARENASYAMGRDEFESRLAAMLPSNPGPEDYVFAAESMTCDCERCGGSGRYAWGAIINGKVSHVGDCYRCEGKGYQDQDDMSRNRSYDRFAIVRALSA